MPGVHVLRAINIMNALFELIGKSEYVTQKESETITDTPEYTVEFGKSTIGGRWKGHIKVHYHYRPTSKIAKEFVKSIAFAKIQYGNDVYEEQPVIAELRSNRNERDELKFLEILASINYNNGYGGQELFGTIVFKDNTWLERGEYDGSEWWERRELPTEESLFSK